MGTQRYISTTFWDDPWVRTLSPEERYLYLYFLTCPLTNIAGVYQISYERMCFDASLDMAKVKRIIKKFEVAGKAYYYKKIYIVLPKWPKHQKWQTKKKIEIGITAILSGLPPDLLGFLKNIGYTYPIDNLSVPYPYQPNYSDSDLDLDLDLDLDSDLDSDLDNIKNLQESENQETSTAVAVARKDIDSIAHSPPKKTKKKLELTEDQMPLFHAAKACFETSEKAKALMYQDDGSTAREMSCLKKFVIRCCNIEPGMTADFMRNVLEHFKMMCNGKQRGKMVFTPHCLITPWVWALVINDLPTNTVTPELQEIIKGLFK